jgi:hypothetical protein
VTKCVGESTNDGGRSVDVQQSSLEVDSRLLTINRLSVAGFLFEKSTVVGFFFEKSTVGQLSRKK